jgi:hypothetical protein
MTQEQMRAMNRAASYNASITDVMNAHKAMSGGQSGSPSGGQASVQPVSGAPAQAKQSAGGGGKGGRPDIDPSKVADSKFNNDKSYGYYRPDGTYVSAFTDMRDGGGKNQSGNYFVGGGLFSSLANALKIRPAGAASERDPKTGEYIVPREDIGYRDFKDMRDRGGPQASGGKFQGGGHYSDMANFVYGLSGKDFGERVPYGSSVQPAPTAPQTPVMATPEPAPAPNYRFMYSDEVGRGVAPDNYGIGVGGEYAGAVPAQLVGAPTGPSVGDFNTLAATVPDNVPPTARQMYLDFVLGGGKMNYTNWILSQ